MGPISGADPTRDPRVSWDVEGLTVKAATTAPNRNSRGRDVPRSRLRQHRSEDDLRVVSEAEQLLQRGANGVTDPPQKEAVAGLALHSFRRRIEDATSPASVPNLVQQNI